MELYTYQVDYPERFKLEKTEKPSEDLEKHQNEMAMIVGMTTDALLLDAQEKEEDKIPGMPSNFVAFERIRSLVQKKEAYYLYQAAELAVSIPPIAELIAKHVSRIMPTHFFYEKNSGIEDDIYEMEAKYWIYLALRIFKALPDNPAVQAAARNVKIVNLSLFYPQEFPIEVYSLSELEMLNLGANDFKKIPPGISQLKKLKFLDLSDNENLTVPEEIADLPALEELFMGHINLQKIPDFIYRMRSLKYLNIQGNELEELPEELATLPLEVLDVSSLELIQELPAALGTMHTLRELNLQFTSVSRIPETWANLKLKVLTLSNTDIEEFPVHMTESGTLEKLYLADTQITGLPNELKRQPLRSLNIGGAKQMAQMPELISELPYLENLNIDGTSFPLPAWLPALPLKKLSCTGRQFTPAEWELIASMQNLEELQINVVNHLQLAKVLCLENLKCLHIRGAYARENPEVVAELRERGCIVEAY